MFGGFHGFFLFWHGEVCSTLTRSPLTESSTNSANANSSKKACSQTCKEVSQQKLPSDSVQAGEP
jgi:hypothetical protein